MKKSTIIILVIVAVIGIIIGTLIGRYNSIVSLEENVSKQESNIDVLLKRRTDLIPNLVEVVKEYAEYEKSVIEDVSNARKELINAKTMEEKAEANNALDSAITKVLALQENYPDLKANTQFTTLTDELAGSENRIAVARKDYNTSVETYNTFIKKFPNNIISNMFGFGTKEYFKASDSDKDVPEVSF